MVYLNELQPYGFWAEIGGALKTAGGGLASGIGKIGGLLISKEFWETVPEITTTGLSVWLTAEQIKALKAGGYLPESATEEAGYYTIPPVTPAKYTAQPAIPREYIYLAGLGFAALILILLLKK